MDNLGERIKLARQAAGLRQADLALKVGVSTTTVKNWERNGRVKDRLGAIERVLGVSLTDADPGPDNGPRLAEASVPMILAHLGTRWAEHLDTIAGLRAEVENLRPGAVTPFPRHATGRPRLVGRPRDNGNHTADDTTGVDDTDGGAPT